MFHILTVAAFGTVSYPFFFALPLILQFVGQRCSQDYWHSFQVFESCCPLYLSFWKENQTVLQLNII